MGGEDSIINGLKDIFKAILISAIALLFYALLFKSIGIFGYYVTLFILAIATILFIIGIIKVLYGIITL